jgi:hypothetical protein
VAASVSTVLMLVGLLAVVFGRAAGRPLLTILAALGPPLALAVVTYGLAWCATLVLTGGPAAVICAAAASVAYLAVLRARFPAHWELVGRLLAPLASARRAPAHRAAPAARDTPAR